METNAILQADILDILFDGRNKEYGAYQLRKTYTKRLFIAIACMSAIVGIFTVIQVTHHSEGTDTAIPLYVKPVELINLPEKQESIPETPPPPKSAEVQTLEITKFTPLNVVKDELMEPDEKLPSQDALANTNIGAINQTGIKSSVLMPPVEQSTGGVEAPKTVTQDYEGIFTVVQVEAKFPGGAAAWKKFLERNLNSNVPVDNGAPASKYTVVVSFLVDKNGIISDITALNDPGYGTAEEAVRVLKKSPQWVPALQNGRNVIYRQKQQITFIVTEQ